MAQDVATRPNLMVLASTYPRWAGDPEPSFVHELARRLTDRFNVTVLCPHAPGAASSEVMDGVRIIRYRYAPSAWETLVNDGGIVANLRRSKWKALLLPGFFIGQLWAACRLARRGRVDVIHAHWLVPQGLVAAVLRLASRRKPPFIVTSHGADLYALNGLAWDAAKRFVARAATALAVVSGAMREELARLGVAGDGVRILPMGVDLSSRFTPDAPTVRSPGEILFVGRLVEKKGVRHLLDAMPAILARHSSATLSIAGFGPEESALRARVGVLGLGHAVRFLGPVPQSDLPALYRRAAVFVAPFVQAAGGDREGLGLVTIEAIGCGCPVVVGDLPAVRDVLDPDEASGMLVPPGDPVALAEAVSGILDDPVGAAQRVARLRAQVVQRFDWQQVAARYRALLSEAGSTG